jgi:hypothetical protein
MKKQMQKLQLRKSTVSNLDRAALKKVEGGAGTFRIICRTQPAGCTTTQISNCTACYSCIECASPPQSFQQPCNEL